MTYEQSILLTDKQWSSLSDEAKIQVLQAIENHTAFEAGRLNCPVVGKFLYTGNDGVVLGTYDPQSKVIYVNSSQFDAESKYGKTSETLVTTCLHEGRHAYQHQVADGIITHNDPAEAEAWKDNLSDGNYISFKENPRAYYNQPVEVDARRFAEEKYTELVAERQRLIAAEKVDQSQRSVFERQLSSDSSTSYQRAPIIDHSAKEANGLSAGH